MKISISMLQFYTDPVVDPAPTTSGRAMKPPAFVGTSIPHSQYVGLISPIVVGCISLGLRTDVLQLRSFKQNAGAINTEPQFLFLSICFPYCIAHHFNPR